MALPRFVGTLLFALTWSSAPALAQEVEPETPLAPASDTEAELLDEEGAGMDEEARSLFRAGDTAFEQGRFENALDYFERAYELSGRPELLFNIGSAADRLRQNERALSAFRAYLEQGQGIDNRANVERRVEVLEQEVANRQDARAPSERSDGPGPLPFVAMGVGGAFVVAGAVFLGVALSDKSALENPDGITEFTEELRDRADRVPLFSALGWTGLVAGTVLVAGGLTWALASGDDETVEVAVLLGSVSLRGAF